MSIPFRSGRPSQIGDRYCGRQLDLVSIPFRSGRPSQPDDCCQLLETLTTCQSPSDRGVLHREVKEHEEWLSSVPCVNPLQIGASFTGGTVASSPNDVKVSIPFRSGRPSQPRGSHVIRLEVLCVNPLQIGASFTEETVAWITVELDRVNPLQIGASFTDNSSVLPALVGYYRVNPLQIGASFTGLAGASPRGWSSRVNPLQIGASFTGGERPTPQVFECVSIPFRSGRPSQGKAFSGGSSCGASRDSDDHIRC